MRRHDLPHGAVEILDEQIADGSTEVDAKAVADILAHQRGACQHRQKRQGVVPAPLAELFEKCGRPDRSANFVAASVEILQGRFAEVAQLRAQAVQHVLGVHARSFGTEVVDDVAVGVRAGRYQLFAIVRGEKAVDGPAPGGYVPRQAAGLEMCCDVEDSRRLRHHQRQRTFGGPTSARPGQAPSLMFSAIHSRSSPACEVNRSNPPTIFRPIGVCTVTTFLPSGSIALKLGEADARRNRNQKSRAALHTSRRSANTGKTAPRCAPRARRERSRENRPPLSRWPMHERRLPLRRFWAGVVQHHAVQSVDSRRDIDHEIETGHVRRSGTASTATSE